MKSIFFIFMVSLFFVNTTFADEINYDMSGEARQKYYKNANPALKGEIDKVVREARHLGHDLNTREGRIAYINYKRQRAWHREGHELAQLLGLEEGTRPYTEKECLEKAGGNKASAQYFSCTRSSRKGRPLPPE